MIKISLNAILITLGLLAAVPAALASRAGSGTLDPDWTWHSSFDDGVRKVIDTPNRVYFFTHQRPYFSQGNYSSYYANPSGAIFFLDKANPGAGIQDYHHFAAFSGLDMRLFAVNPDNDMKVIAYQDGGVDLIDAGNHVTYLSDIKDRPLPGGALIGAISFDRASGDIWLSTNRGFMHVDSRGKTLHFADFGKKVSDICRVGNRVIAIIGGRLHEAPAAANLSRLDSFTEISGMSVNTPTRLMPLTDNTLAYLNESNAIIGMAHTGEAWTISNLAADGGISENTADKVVCHKQDHTVIPTSDGYYVASNGTAYLVRKPVGTATMPTVSTLGLVSGSSRYSSSYDGKTVWSYTDRGKFFSCTYPDKTRSEAIRPDAPLTAMDARFVYSPKYGLLSVNIDPQRRIDLEFPKFPPALASYKNGKWANLSPTYNVPDVISTNESYLATYKSNLYHFPVADPMGVTIDPEFDNVLHLGSDWDGIAALYLDDTRKMPLMYLSSRNAMSSLPVNKTLTNGSWTNKGGNYTGTYIAGYDNSHNLWMYRSTAFGIANPGNVHQLWYLTPDARREALAKGDATLYGDWGVIRFTMPADPSTTLTALALRHPDNANKLVVYSKGCGSSITVIDHKGTLTDASDDEVSLFTNILLPNGSLFNSGNVYDFIENPLTGELIVCTRNETVVIDLKEKVEDSIIHGKMLTIPSDAGSGYDFLSPMICNSACFDEYGRLWLAHTNAGVVGFSPDYSKIVAYYTTANSPLLSNNIHGVGWNPDTRSLFISTDCGIAEVNVDDYSVAGSTSGEPSDAPQAPFALPERVTPDFTGVVSVHNVPAVTTLRVTDASGRVIRTLPPTENGVTYWDLLDNSGKRVETGRYSIGDAVGDAGFRALSVTVVR